MRAGILARRVSARQPCVSTRAPTLKGKSIPNGITVGRKVSCGARTPRVLFRWMHTPPACLVCLGGQGHLLARFVEHDSLGGDGLGLEVVSKLALHVNLLLLFGFGGWED